MFRVVPYQVGGDTHVDRVGIASAAGRYVLVVRPRMFFKKHCTLEPFFYRFCPVSSRTCVESKHLAKAAANYCMGVYLCDQGTVVC